MSSSKIVQLIGEYDREFGTYAFNRTESQFQIRGADLGSSFLHGGKLYFLFGDTPRTQVPLPLKPNMSDYARQYFLDSIAYTTDPFVFGGLKLTFNSQYPLVNDISQGDFEVPTEGVSVGGNMYVYFTTDHTNQRVMGRTVLARSTDGGLNFGDSLYTLSTDKFINVSVQIVKNGQLAGLPIPAENGLLIFGSGQYRASDVCLVYMPLDAIEDPSKSKLRYFAGLAPGSSLPLWSAEETQAVPLFQAGCIGEFSVRWNFYLGRWFILYNCGNPRGIILRTATLPWGPWSDSNRIFHPWEDGGYCHFMHRAWEADPATHCDNVADDMWNPGQFRVDEWGGEYGPYQIQPYVSGVKGHYTKIYYTLSTANPYSVMQMTTVILTEGEALDPNAYAYDATVPNDRKYARISILQAQLAAARNMSWDFLGQGSQSCADHIEWAQFQSHFELRAELKGKFLQMMTKLADPGARADAYANITDTVVTLGADGPYDFVNYNAHYGWALNAIQNGHPEWLVSEMNMRIDREHFLPDHDDWCYAYGSDAPNERKYGRVSILQARLATQNGMSWDSPGQGTLDGNAHVTWARFQPVEVMRQELKGKFLQMMTKLADPGARADAYANITDTVVTLGADGPYDFVNYNAHYGWALNAIQNGHPEWLVSEMNMRIDREHFLPSMPTV